MDSTLIVVTLIIAIAVIILVWMLKGKDRIKMGAKGPGGWQADIEADSGGPSPVRGIRAGDIEAREGNVNIRDHTGTGVDAERVRAGQDVDLSSGTPGKRPDPKA